MANGKPIRKERRKASGPSPSRSPRGPQGPRVQGGSREARKVAAAMLEVLGGIRTPQDAAAALGISPSRYYVLEGRGLEGLVQACERRDKGPRTSPEQEAERLRKELVRVKKDLVRHQALARAAQRAVGLAAARAPEPKAGKSGKKRRRRPTVRALKAARQLQSGPTPDKKSVAGDGVPGGASVASSA